MADPTSPLLDIYLKEYDKLKSEQADRIGFRDNLIYVTIAVISGLLAAAFGDPPNHTVLLVVPWAMLILGWTYLINDEKISAMGKYIRLTLDEKIKPLAGAAKTEALLGWEVAHRSDPRRGRRKIEQLIIDEITFVLPGVISLILYGMLTAALPTPPQAQVIMAVEAFVLAALGVEIVLYADLGKGR